MESDIGTISELPRHLAERTRSVTDRPVDLHGSFILYWMRTAVRAEENPALDTALEAGFRLGRPVFVYHGLSERYSYASDRHHRFILEGARDAHAAFLQRGIGYAFHLERPGQRGPHLRSLAERAALVVTEDLPVRPLRRWSERLACCVGAPVWLVDTACVVPMRLVGRSYDRAFAFRRATAHLLEERLRVEWPITETRTASFTPDLPFDPVDLQDADLPTLIAECEIDHTVGPVPHTPGGSKAGYERWEAFRRGGLEAYAVRRNDPLRDGVSRLSPYLHYGHVSPFRIAREAAAVPGDGPRKFLDELLVWRELAHNFCFHRGDYDTIAALPTWARENLQAHESDPRPALFSQETLARARTGDALWDAAQRSLLIHGQLHNNVRMTWGKAILSWTAGPERALESMIDLNHRYALDGRDPNSYGGMLWCLGLFDRPFRPDEPILGAVRPRPTAHHASRLDVERYGQRTSHPALARPPRVAVVGAGVSGLICAATLADHGLEVVVFDKGRRPGGRLATRRSGVGEYDHGAQYFTVRDRRFERRVQSWIQDGRVARWNGRLIRVEDGRVRRVSDETRRYVGVPGMNRIAAHLAEGLDVRAPSRIEAILRHSPGWLLRDEEGEEAGPFDRVVVAVPAPQAVPLLEVCPELRSQVAGVGMDPCWALLVTFDRALDIDFDGAFINDEPLAWVARNGSKPGRERGESWVLHASRKWTRDHLEVDNGRVAALLLESFARVAGTRLPDAVDLRTHRWRYALPGETPAQPCLYDDCNGLAVCGDWCVGPRVEDAFLSGAAAAGRVLGSWDTRVVPSRPPLYSGRRGPRPVDGSHRR